MYVLAVLAKVNIRFLQSRRHGGFSGLSLSQTKLQASPNWNMKHYKSVEFVTFYNVKPPLHKRKTPIENFLATVWKTKPFFKEK